MKPVQLRMARAGLGITQKRVANDTGLSVQTIKRLEGSASLDTTRQKTVADLKAYYEGWGIDFVSGEGTGSAPAWGTLATEISDSAATDFIEGAEND